jgi:CBS domain-containing protein
MEPLVSAVMHRNVVAVGPQTSFHEIARILVSRRISAVPVVDADRHVLGVISADDLLSTRPSPFRYSQRASRVAPGRAAGRTAAELMSAPALAIHPETTIGRAADLMQARHVKRLPVVDEERRLLGIVARSDLLEVYLRGAYGPGARVPEAGPSGVPSAVRRTRASAAGGAVRESDVDG